MNIKEIESDKNRLFFWGMLYLFCIGVLLTFPVIPVIDYLCLKSRMLFGFIWNGLIVLSTSFYLIFHKLFFRYSDKLNALTTLERC